MAKILKFSFLLAGLGFFIWSLKFVDVSQVLKMLADVGFGFVLIMGVYALVTYIDTIAWRYAFHPEQACRLNLLPLWRIRQIGESYNIITPLGTVGGEPVKAQLLKDFYQFTFKQGLASLVLSRTTFLTALIIFFIPGIYLILNSQIVTGEFKTISLVGMVVFTTLIFLFFLFQVTGMLGVLASWVGRLFPKHKEHSFLNHLQVLNTLMSAYYKEYQGRIALSIFYALVGWVVGLGELYLALHYLGYDPSFQELWVIEALIQLVRVGSFFIPMSLGAQEGGLILIFVAMGLTPDLGLAVSFVRRIKEIIWVSAGLLLGWTLAFKPPKVQPEI
ncbi:MAG: lysylphosphatidylglycerol synthase transmembrane domain-containing protein [Nitrospinae bacterium]|jgi:glycosyltransferase 2 family protein|nr:lysylphosphatidylglycerol synthase transmembrane domain-containing protein [Nitrospinota bacterium]MDA1110704.1 lysylphosphatidylglycerol synthase transmembrane domain-containing protein [Nitrospinota bacterium]